MKTNTRIVKITGVECAIVLCENMEFTGCWH